MRIFSNQLKQHLSKLPQILMVFGDDILIREECRDALRQACFDLGAEERLSLVQESPFNWQSLMEECQALSLFASKRVIELELPTLKPGTDGSPILVELAKSLPQQQDTWLLLHGPKPAREQTNSKWFKALDKDGLYVQATTPEGPHYQRWIGERTRRYQVQLSPDAQHYLASLFEGNLLAADQALAQLGLSSEGKLLEQNDIAELLDDQSRYSVFQLSDHLLTGNVDAALKILIQLRQEGVAPNLVHWAISKELTLLAQMKLGQQQGQNLAQIFKQERIWQSRQRLYQQCLNRLPVNQIADALSLAGQLELMLKGEALNDAETWLPLTELCVRFSADYLPMEASQ